MPYRVVSADKRHCVEKQGADGEWVRLKCYDVAADADAYFRALNAAMAETGEKAGEGPMLRAAIAALGRSRIGEVLRTAATRAMVDAYVHASDLVGQPLVFDPQAPSTARLLSQVGERIRGIEETTRQRVEHYITVGTNEGWGPREIGRLIREDPSGAFSPARAELIARTETGTLWNSASLDGYRASGRVEKVLIFDGEDCGWTSHDDPDKAAGTTRTLEDAEGNELSHPNCCVGETMVLAPNVTAAFARWFEGEGLVLRTAADDLLTCTPNHPILTRRGWVAANLVKEGDEIVRCVDGQAVARLLDPDHYHVPSRIEDIARAILESGECSPATVPTAAVAFHGDGVGSEVHVVGANRLRERRRDALLQQHGGKRALSISDVRLGALLASGALGQVVGCSAHATNGGVRRGGSPLSLVCPDVGEVEPQRVGLRPQFVAAPMPCSPQANTTDTKGGCDLVTRLASLITLVRVVNVERVALAAHVYNLQTREGWYIANGIIAHNCVRSWAPVVDLD